MLRILRTYVKDKGLALASRYAHTCASRRPRGVPLAYHNLGPPSHQCSKYDATMNKNRVFKMKLTELSDDLTKKQIFRDCCAVVYVIEFQKQGLPHTRILLWLEERLKCTTLDEINDIIFAELPSPAEYPDRDNKVTAKNGKFSYNNQHVVSYNWRTLQPMLMGHQFRFPRGAKSFKELMTVNKQTYTTFKVACFVYGLLNDDKEWSQAIAKARFWAMGPQMRDLFVTILLFCDVSQPLQRREENWTALSKDILNKIRILYKYQALQLTNKQIRNYCLLEIQTLLNSHERSLAEFQDLPRPNSRLLTNLDNRLIREALDFDVNKIRVKHEQLHSLLNPKQCLVYDKVIEFVHSESGIASLLLPGSRTAHNIFVTPLEFVEKSTCCIKHNTHLAELMQQVKLIIWDEAPMTQRYAFEALDKTLRDKLGYKSLEKRNRIFGGMTVFLGEIDIRKQNFNRWVLAVGDGKLAAMKKEIEDEPIWIEILEEFLIKL
nr:ATP-dependent DNA helicase PIF1-like [Tanacetum cinerariifolium]